MKLADLPTLLDALRKTPVAVARLLNGLSGDQLTWKPAPGEFSMLENVCHLRDIEQDGYLIRVRRLLLENNPELQDLDGDRLASERRYNQQDIAAAHTAFTSARKLTVKSLAGVTEADLLRGGSMERIGRVTLGSMLENLRDHDAEHLRLMRELRARLLSEPA
jgi:hypothetical protein